MEDHTIYFNDGDWRLVIGAKLGHGAATGEPRAGGVRSSVKTAGQVRLSPPRGGRPM